MIRVNDDEVRFTFHPTKKNKKPQQQQQQQQPKHTNCNQHYTKSKKVLPS
jgi:hypothetical protein